MADLVLNKIVNMLVRRKRVYNKYFTFQILFDRQSANDLLT